MGASMIETTDAALRAKVDGLEKQIDDTPQFAREYLGLWVLDAQALQALRKELEAERDKLVKERDALKQECDRQALLCSKANDEREELESERDKLRERNALLEARISNAGAGTIQVVEQNRWLKTVVADLRAQLSAAERKLAEAQKRAQRELEAKCERGELIRERDDLRTKLEEAQKRARLVERAEAGERVYMEVAKKAEKRAADAESERDDLLAQLPACDSWYRAVENRISKLETRFEEDRDEAVKERDDFLKRVEQRLDLLLNQPRSEASPSSPKPYTP